MPPIWGILGSYSHICAHLPAESVPKLCLLLASVLFAYSSFTFMHVTRESCLPLFEAGNHICLSKETDMRPRICGNLEYSTRRARRCTSELKKRTGQMVKFIIAGDSRMRQLSYGLRDLFSNDDWDSLGNFRIPETHPKHLTYVSVLNESNVILDFVWMRYPDDGLLDQVLDRVSSNVTAAENNDSAVLIINCGVWITKRCRDEKKTGLEECMQSFERSLHILRPKLKKAAQSLPVFWAPQNYIFDLWVLDKPFGVTHTDQLRYNEIAKRQLSGTGVVFWDSFLEASQYYNDSRDGVHLGMSTRRFSVNTLMNYLCNPLIEYAASGSSCCTLDKIQGFLVPTLLKCLCVALLACFGLHVTLARCS